MSESRPVPRRLSFEGFGLPNRRSLLAATLLLVFVLAAVASIETANAALVATKDWVIGRFDWLFVLVATFSVLAVAVLAIHPRTNLRLGPPDSRPEFGTLAWFAMLFSAGLASGLLYWAAAEPILHQQANPFLSEAGGPQQGTAVTTAMRLTVLHWGLHGWAFYVLAGLGIAVAAYRHDLPLTFRSALLPILGKRNLDRWPGHLVDLIALFGTVCGVATSIGLSAAALNATLGSLVQLDVNVQNQIVIVFGVCMLGILSALSGLARGIRRLSEVNLWVSLLLLLAFVALGPTGFLADLFVGTVVDYVSNVVPTGMWLAETEANQAWQADWTVFYWGWWLAWTPFVGVFIARISRGRTLREFAIAVMLVPTFVTLVWMTVFGGTALHQELVSPGAVSAAVDEDYSLGIVAVIENLARPGISTLLMATATFLLFTWLITSLDSATLVICHLLGAGESQPAKTFWGLALAAVTAVLLLVGGLQALQAASIVIGLPLAGIVLLLGCGLLWDLGRRPSGPQPARSSQRIGARFTPPTKLDR